MLCIMKITVVTLFPELFPGGLSHSITGRALKDNLWSLSTVQIRDFGVGKHKSVDDYPYGGGAGQLMKADVVAQAIEKAKTENKDSKVIYMSPCGQPLTTAKAAELSKEEGLILLCGHYEGIDQRVLDTHVDEEISIGDYVLTGGEVAVPVVVDAVLRHVDGVLGNSETLHEESFDNGLLEYPHYTRPAEWNGNKVPDVLLSGNHKKIEDWRLAQAEDRTKDRRPDLFEKYKKTK